MAAWPSTLPAPLIAGYGVAPLDRTIRTEMEAGASRVRQRSAARLDQVQVAWEMTDAQMAAFRAWFNDTSTGISGGASWFTGLPLRLGMGGTESRDCRFVGPPRLEFEGANGAGRWRISGAIEVR